jgi:D-3-phosphoglycerate dehydrogenase
MKIVILDDYQDAVRGLACYTKLAGHDVTIYRDTVKDADALAKRLADAEAVVLIRERTRLPAALIERLPKLRIISQTGRPGAHIDMEACTRKAIAVCETRGSPVAPAELPSTRCIASAPGRNIRRASPGSLPLPTRADPGGRATPYPL